LVVSRTIKAILVRSHVYERSGVHVSNEMCNKKFLLLGKRNS
jgi:hypothetical protein